MCSPVYYINTHADLSNDGGQAGVVEALVVHIRLLIPLPVCQLYLQSLVHPISHTVLQ